MWQLPMRLHPLTWRLVPLLSRPQNNRIGAGCLCHGGRDAGEDGSGIVQSASQGYARGTVRGDAAVRQQRRPHEVSKNAPIKNGKKRLKMSGLVDQRSDHLVPAYAINKSPNSLAFGVGLLTYTRRFPLEAGHGALVRRFLSIHSYADSRHRHAYVSLRNNPRFVRQTYPLLKFISLAGSLAGCDIKYLKIPDSEVCQQPAVVKHSTS